MLEEETGIGQESAVERKVIAKRYVFNSFYLFGSFLMLVGLCTAIWTLTKGGTWSALLGLIVFLPGVWLIWFPLRQLGLPIELIVTEGDELVVTDTGRKTLRLHAADVVSVSARRNLAGSFNAPGRSTRRTIHCGYVYLETVGEGRLRIGYVYRPYDVAERVTKTLEALRGAACPGTGQEGREQP